MDARTRRLLVKIARLVDGEEDDPIDDEEELAMNALPLVYEARRLLDDDGIEWREE